MFGFGCAKVVQQGYGLQGLMMLSPEAENLAPSEPPLPNRKVDVEDVVVVADAQSAPNEVGVCPGVRAPCGTDDVVATPQEIL
jgi:hypothetical protein